MEKKVTRWVLSILVMAMIITGLVSTTYALFSVDLYAPNPDVYSTGTLAITANSKTDTISLANVLPMSDEKGVTTNPYVFTIKNIGNLAYLFDVKLLSTGESATSFSPQYIKLKIDDGEVTTLSSLINSEIKSDVVLSAGESIDISVRVWLSSDTPNSELGKGFNSKIVTSGEALYTNVNGNATLVSKLYSLYNNAEKTQVLNNGITYNYANSVSLMNDKLGGTTSDYNAGNIRYYGANPNNYIYFNCNDYSYQSSETCELWRIIGVFDGKVKIVNTENIGKDTSEEGFDWDYDYNNDLTSVSFNNDWTMSSLNVLLNGAYYNNQDTVYYVWDHEALEAKFKTNRIGLKNEDTRNMIATATWNLGGYGSDNVFSDEVYRYERGTDVYEGNKTTWTGKIALMYASDYGYATDFNSCNQMLINYIEDTNNYACRSNNYLYTPGMDKWLLNHDNTSDAYVWTINGSGGIYYDLETVNSYAVYPTLYLNSEVSILSGTGTIGDPYRIGV